MPKVVEVSDIVTIKGEVTHILDEGRIIIVEIRGAVAPVGVPESAIATVAKP